MSRSPGSWRIAWRLARRQVRRHPWRHLLVVALVYLPVLAALLAFSAVATFRAVDGRHEAFEYGDPSVIQIRSEQMASDGGNGQDLRTAEARRDLSLPEGTRTEVWWSSADWFYGDRMRPDGDGPDLVGAATIEVPHGSASAEQFVVEHGRLPRGTDEIFLTEPLAHEGGWQVGDTIRSARGDRSFEVVGTGLLGYQTNRRAAAVTGLPDSYWTRGVAGLEGIDIGEGYPQSPVATQVLRARVADPAARIGYGEGFDRSSIDAVDGRIGAGLTMASAAVCAVVAVVASAAFAISSRRQLRSVGLLSTIGIDPTTIRRSLVLQGAIPGAIAGLAAVATAVVGAAIANTTSAPQRISQVAGARVSISASGALIAVLLGIASGVAAAWQPARTASRIPTLSALAGRRPVGPVRTRVPVAGLILWGCGIAALVFGFGNDRSGLAQRAEPLMIIAGIAAVALGGVGLAPLMVALLGPLARRFRGTWRLGLRGLARHRMQSAASVAAIGVVLAIPVGLSTTRNGLADRTGSGAAEACCASATPTVPSATAPSLDVLLDPSRATQIAIGGDLGAGAADAAIADVKGVLGDSAAAIRTIPLVDQQGAWQEVAVIDERDAPAVLAPWAADAIAAGRAIGFGPAHQQVTLRAEGDEATFDVDLPDEEGQLRQGLPLNAAYLVGATALGQVGATRPTTSAAILRATPLSSAERRQLRELPGYDGPGSSWNAEPPTLARVQASLDGPNGDPGRGAARISLLNDGRAPEPPRSGIEERTPRDEWSTALLLGVAASTALALLVLTITLSLRSVDGEADRRAAFAAGVAPAALRHQRAFEGVVLALLGALLALPLGWIPVAAARVGVDRTQDPRAFGEVFSLPGVVVIPILLLPALAAAVCWTAVPAAADRVRAMRHRDLPDGLVPRW